MSARRRRRFTRILERFIDIVGEDTIELLADLRPLPPPFPPLPAAVGEAGGGQAEREKLVIRAFYRVLLRRYGEQEALKIVEEAEKEYHKLLEQLKR